MLNANICPCLEVCLYILCIREDEEEDRKWCIMLGTINNSPAAAWQNWELHSPGESHQITHFYTFSLSFQAKVDFILYFSITRGIVELNIIYIYRYQRYLQSLKIAQSRNRQNGGSDNYALGFLLKQIHHRDGVSWFTSIQS